MRWTSLRRTLLALAIVGTAAVGASQTVAATVLPPGGTFTDDNGNVHEGNIEAIHAVGIANGCAPTLYCPDIPLTRGQMAALLTRALDLPPSANDWFDDAETSAFEAEINSLAEAGITLGCSPSRFCPNDPVSRAEMASFLVRGFGLPPTPSDHFADDDGSVHEDDINALAATAITLGCGTDRYCPQQSVLRSEMASFLARALGLAPIDPPPLMGGAGDLWVDNRHIAADDDNPGTAQAPLRTIGEAIMRSDTLRRDGVAVRIYLAAGVYRESIRLNWIGDNPPPLTLEAVTPGTVRITGTDVWTGWRDDGNGMHSAPWPHNWGATSGVHEIVGRREVAFHNGVRLRQVLTLADLAAGSFYVNEAADRIHVHVGQVPLSTVEVAVREKILIADGAKSVTIRGLEFSGANSRFDTSAVHVANVSGLTMAENVVSNNSWVGLSIATSSGVTLDHNEINENGGGGLGAFRVPSLRLIANETSRNNWRGARGGWLGWSIAGVKIVRSHGVVVDGHRSFDNETRGFWVDYDIADLTIKNSTFCGNRTDGLFIEASQGPSTVTNTVMCDNGIYGLLISNGRSISLTNSRLCGNDKSAFRLETDGAAGRTIQTEAGSIVLAGAEHLTILENVFGSSPRLFDSNLPSSHWAKLLSSTHSDRNLFQAGTTTFFYEQAPRTLTEWRTASGEDGSSSLSPGAC